MCEKHKGKTNVEIAKMLNRHPATNGRELKRNKGLRWYRPNQVNKKSQERRYRKSPEITEFGKAFVVHLIQQDWSIEQVSERLRAMGWEDVPSHEWIYSQTTSKLKCVGSPCRIIYTVFGKPPVSLLKLFDYISDEQIAFIENRLNNRPRKTLG